MKVNDAIHTVIFILHRYIIAHRSQIISQVLSACGACPRKYSTLLWSHFSFLFHSTLLLLQQSCNLSRICMAARLQFGIDQLLIHRDLKPPPAGGDQRERFDLRLKIVQQLNCQTGSPFGVVSDRTILNADLHRHSLSSVDHRFLSQKYIIFDLFLSVFIGVLLRSPPAP
jgi:hypothetical protein